MLAHYPCNVSSHRISHVPSGDCFAVVLQIELRRTGVEGNVGPLSWLDRSNQFPPYVTCTTDPAAGCHLLRVSAGYYTIFAPSKQDCIYQIFMRLSMDKLQYRGFAHVWKSLARKGKACCICGKKRIVIRQGLFYRNTSIGSL